MMIDLGFHDRAPGFRRCACLLVLTLVGVGGCATARVPGTGPLMDGWSREEFHPSSTTCSGGSSCTHRFSGPEGGLQVRSRTRTYATTSVPGWDRPAGERAALSVASWAVRQLGGTSTRTVVGLGTRVASGRGAGGLELNCSVFWMDDQDSEFDRRQAMDVTWTAARMAQGMRCTVTSPSDPETALWRLEAGIAPPLDSLAAVHDSLAAVQSPLLSRFPPVSLERLAADGSVAERYVTDHAVPGGLREAGIRLRLYVAREDGERIAVLHVGEASVLDTNPAVGDEERRVLRLVAVLLGVALTETR
jgi:hypothetical protein